MSGTYLEDGYFGVAETYNCSVWLLQSSFLLTSHILLICVLETQRWHNTYNLKSRKTIVQGRENFATINSFLKSNSNVFKRHLSWDKTFVVWTSPLNSNTHLAVLLSGCVCYRQQCTAALCCDRMTVKYTHGDMILIRGTCNSLVLVPVLVLVLVLVPVLVLLPVPVLDSTRTLMRFNSCSSVCVRQEL